MSEEIVKKYNHYYSRFHIKKWQENNGKIFDKTKESKRRIVINKDFTKEYYYSENEPNNELEDRIGDFEAYIGSIIKKVDTAQDSAQLTGKEYEILKLYCVLCANRHHFATEVIKNDESGIYRSNNYLYGVYSVKDKEEALNMTRFILEEFERLKKQSEVQATIYSPIISYYPCVSTIGLHLEILKRDKPDIIISDRCCLTENTLDSDYLYTYVPVSPYTALFLIKSKYYLDFATFKYTKERFGRKYGGGMPDPYLSVVFRGREQLLFSSAYWIRSNVHVFEVYLPQQRAYQVTLKIKDMPTGIVKQMNSMLCEDGDLILYCDKTALETALKERMPYREIDLY